MTTSQYNAVSGHKSNPSINAPAQNSSFVVLEKSQHLQEMQELQRETTQVTEPLKAASQEHYVKLEDAGGNTQFTLKSQPLSVSQYGAWQGMSQGTDANAEKWQAQLPAVKNEEQAAKGAGFSLPAQKQV